MADAMDNRLQEIERSAGTLESQLRAQIAHVKRGMLITLIVGLIFIAAVITYLSILTNAFKPYTDAQTLVDMGKTAYNNYLQEKIPEGADMLAEGAKEAIAALSKEVTEQQKYVPMLRDRAEKESMAVLAKATAQLDTTVDGMVAKVIEDNKDRLTPLIDAAADPAKAAELEQALQDALEELVAPDIDARLIEANKVLDAAQNMLQYYGQPDDQLTEAERAFKYLISAGLTFINSIPADAKITILPDSADAK